MSKIDDLNKWLMIGNALAPLVLMNVKGGGKIAPFIPTITQAILAAEQIPGAKGADKKADVLSTVEAGIAVANATGKVHVDPQEVLNVASAGIDNVIAVINLIHGTHVDVAVPTTPAQ